MKKNNYLYFFIITLVFISCGEKKNNSTEKVDNPTVSDSVVSGEISEGRLTSSVSVDDSIAKLLIEDKQLEYIMANGWQDTTNSCSANQLSFIEENGSKYLLITISAECTAQLPIKVVGKSLYLSWDLSWDCKNSMNEQQNLVNDKKIFAEICIGNQDVIKIKFKNNTFRKKIEKNGLTFADKYTRMKF